MKLTNEELRILIHHYKVRIAMITAIGDSTEDIQKRIEELQKLFDLS